MLIDIFTGWLDGLWELIGKITGNIPEFLSSIVGLIPRGVIFIRSLFQPIYNFIDGVFGGGIFSTIFGTTVLAMTFFSCIGFLVALAFRRGVNQ